MALALTLALLSEWKALELVSANVFASGNGSVWKWVSIIAWRELGLMQ